MECEDCGERCKRRITCFHCGDLVCPRCWHHAHGCGPGHRQSECRDYRAYLKYGKEWIRRLRVRKGNPCERSVKMVEQLRKDTA